ncbi:MAG: hypothetical protein HZC02_05135 [Candidatus Levybacteria bacterium]|nr:hypothetical protein [Candidatus Levybacteria bacterium]
MDFTIFEQFDFFLIVKAIILIFLGLYLIFAILIFNNIRSLNRVVVIQKTLGSPFVQSIGFIYILATIFLFLLAIVIL